MTSTCAFGQIPDIRAKSICLFGKLLVDGDRNILDAANITCENTIVRNILYTNTICEKTTLKGINICGNLTVPEPYTLNADDMCANSICTDLLTSKTSNIIIVSADLDIIGDILGNSITILEGNIKIDGPGQLYSNVININTIVPLNTTTVSVSGDLTVNGNIVSNTVCAANIVCDTIESKSSNSVRVYNNLIINGSNELYSNIINTIELTPVNTTSITVNGNLICSGVHSVCATNIICDTIQSKSSNTISIYNNLCVNEGSSVITPNVREKTNDFGVIIDKGVNRSRYGMLRLHSNVNVGITTSANILPMIISYQGQFGNITYEASIGEVYFKSPLTLPNGELYDNVFVQTNVNMKVQVGNAIAGDNVILSLIKDTCPPSSPEIICSDYFAVQRNVSSPLSLVETLHISDLVSMNPNEILQLQIQASSLSIVGQTLLGSANTNVSFVITGFDPLLI